MPLPTDRGVVVIDVEDDGTSTVRICAEVVNGAPVDVFAEHHGAVHVRVHNDVPMFTHGRRSVSKRIAEVYDDNGTINVGRVRGAA